MSITEFKEAFDPLLIAELSSRIDRALTAYRGAEIESLLRHLLLLAADGKRLRPYLVYLGYGDGDAGLGESLLSLCVGVELFHLFCLVHDDVIDQDPMRRGVPTMHEFAKSLGGGDSRIADSLAILVGDMVFSWAREKMNHPEIQSYVERMIDEVTIGQMIDVRLVALAETSQSALDAMIELKSARYSFVRPLQIGAALRESSEVEEDFFLRFGMALGTAFQLQDDYFDREKDREQNRPTYYTRGYEDQGVAKMKELFSVAHELLDASPLLPEVSLALRTLVSVVEARKK